MDMAQSQPFGELLKRHRLDAGLTQEDLADRAGLSPHGISDLERGARRTPRPSTLTLLAEALGLTEEHRASFFAAVRVVQVQAQPVQAQPVQATSVPAVAGVPGLPHEAAPGVPTPASEGRPQALPIGGFLGALPAEPLVARETEVAQLRSALEAVAGGAGRLLMLVGEPGVGKTRLAQELTLVARDRGFLVAAGRCYEPQEAVAYYPFHEALGTAYAAAPPPLREQITQRWPDVVRLLPHQPAGTQMAAPGAATVSSLGGSSLHASGRDEQQRLFWQVTSFLQALAAVRPVALLLDDLHWADTASLDLVQHLARQARADRILLVGTYRDVEVSRKHPLEAALRDLARERLLERVPVRRLSVEGTRALIGATLGDEPISEEFSQALHSRAEGNPFFTHEMVRALVEQGDVFRRAGVWDRKAIEELELPESVRSVIGQRVGRLSAVGQELLAEASVLGQTFGFPELQAMGGRAEAEVEAALEEARAAGLAREAGGETFGFSHALIQQTLYRELPARKQRRLHRAAAEAIERLPERERTQRVTELADHFLAADEAARALPYALLAGDQARAIFAHSEAQRHYRRALELAGELGDRVREAEALEKLASELGAVTRYDEALALSERAAALYHAVGDVEGEGRAVWLACRQRHQLFQPGVAVARLEPRLEALCAGGLSLAGQARLYGMLARALRLRGLVSEERDAAVTDWPRALAAAEQALDLAQAAADEEVLAEAMFTRALALLALGRLDESMRDMETVAASAEATGRLDLAANALATAQDRYQCRGEFAASRRCIERAVALVERTGDPWTMAFVWDNHGELAYFTGDWDQARADYERAVATIRGVETTLTYTFPPLILGLLCLAQGQSEAVASLAEPLALAEREHDLQALRIGHGFLAERDLLEGRPEAARVRLEPLLDRPGVQEFQVQYVLPQLAWASLELGNAPHAETLAAESVARARADRHDLFLVDALRVQALVATRQGQWHEAAAALEESIGLCRAMPYPYAEAKALHVYGQLHAAKGEPEQAREKYHAALAICERLGEGHYRPHIEWALVGLEC